MDESTETAAQARLRNTLAKYRERNRYGKFPDRLRDEALAYARERCREGASARQVAAELGVRKETAEGWIRWEKGGAPPLAPRSSQPLAHLSLVPVKLKAEPAAERWGRLEVEFAEGTRLVVSGTGTHALVDAIQALRGSR